MTPNAERQSNGPVRSWPPLKILMPRHLCENPNMTRCPLHSSRRIPKWLVPVTRQNALFLPSFGSPPHTAMLSGRPEILHWLGFWAVHDLLNVTCASTPACVQSVRVCVLVCTCMRALCTNVRYWFSRSGSLFCMVEDAKNNGQKCVYCGDLMMSKWAVCF